MPDLNPCPFCGFKPDQGENELILHIETQHPDADQSPFAVNDEPVPCPEDGCGELVQPDELAYHLELHELEAQGATPEPEPEPATGQHPAVSRKSEPSTRDSTRRHKKVSAIQAWKDLFSGHGSRSPQSRDSSSSSSRTRHKTKREEAGISKSPNRGSSSRDSNGDRSRKSGRLGRSELGRFAHERKMPPWLVDLLQDEGQVANDGVLPVLGQLLEQNATTQYAYLCHPAVHHISKLRREVLQDMGHLTNTGGFCGYRNIQMLTSNIIAAKTPGSHHFGPAPPSIFQIQDLIENAWDMGINAQGRAETGGVKGTRKYIGTPEVLNHHTCMDVSSWLTRTRRKLFSSVWKFRMFTMEREVHD
ncbi:hypothetical protein ACHAQD_003305 [Fusarium lateritium]